MRNALAVILCTVILATGTGVFATGTGVFATGAGLPPLVVSADDAAQLYSVRDRFGVCMASGFGALADFPSRLSDFYDIESLGFGWYSDWGYEPGPQTPDGIEYAQLIPTNPWPIAWDYVEQTVRANPEALFIVGNEPETRGQGQHTPEEYAERYHAVYHRIKAIAPEAQIAIGGIVMPSPLRLQWLDRCLDHYQATYGERMPIDVWNIHVQILQELQGGWGCGIPHGLDATSGRMYEIIDNSNVAAFEQLVEEFCAWLVERGERDKPLVISEYGVLMPSSYLPHGDDSVLEFMEGTFDYLLTARDQDLGYAADDHHLVQRWMWFSLNFPFYDNTPGGFNGALYYWDEPSELTVFGEFFREYANNVELCTVSIEAVEDTYVTSAAPETSHGNEGRIKVRSNGDSGSALGLLRFAVSDLPEEADIVDAELVLQVVNRSNRNSLRVGISALVDEWDSSTTYDRLMGAGPTEASALGYVLLPEPEGTLRFDVTELVQSWREGTQPNYGVAIDAQGAGNTGSVTYDIASSEWREGDHATPQIQVTYLIR